MVVFVYANGQQLGPYDLNTLKAEIQRGAFTLSALGWYEGLPQWQELKTLPEVVQAVMPPLPGAAVPPPIPASSYEAPPPLQQSTTPASMDHITPMLGSAQATEIRLPKPWKLLAAAAGIIGVLVGIAFCVGLSGAMYPRLMMIAAGWWGGYRFVGFIYVMCHASAQVKWTALVIAFGAFIVINGFGFAADFIMGETFTMGVWKWSFLLSLFLCPVAGFESVKGKKAPAQ